MISEYVEAAMEKAVYEIIENEEPYFGHIEELQGVWATGKTFEECRRELKETLEEWIVLSIQRGLPIPSIDGHQVKLPTKNATNA